MLSLNSIIALSKRDFLVTYRNFTDILSILLFFLLGILIFIFSIGPNKEIFNEINLGILWSLILLSNTLYIRNFFQNDFNNNSLVIFHMSGLSYELIVLIKILTTWFFLQVPFLIIIPIAGLFLNIDINNMTIIILSFLIGSAIITCISSISGSMNLLNKKNFAIGSLIVMIFAIPVIIFSVNIVHVSEILMKAQLNILLGIMLFFISITPWVCGACIRISFQNK